MSIDWKTGALTLTRQLQTRRNLALIYREDFFLEVYQQVAILLQSFLTSTETKRCNRL